MGGCDDITRYDLFTIKTSGLVMPVILSRYIIFSILRGFFLVALILVALFSLILLIEELDEVGTGSYSVMIALKYVLLHMPQLVLDFSTIISLIGAVIALGSLVNNSELVAMNSLACTPRRIIATVLFAAMLLMTGVFLLAQFVTPYTVQEAKVMRSLALNQQGDTVNSSGYWAQKDRRFLHVKEIRFGRIPTNIEIFEFDHDYQLNTYIQAAKVTIQDDNKWLLNDVSIKTMTAQGMQLQQLDQHLWQSFLDADQLGIIISEPNSLSMTDLYRYIEGLKLRDAQSYHFEIMFWQKCLIPVAGLMMTLLGMLFVFGSQRIISASQRTILGILAGVGFYIYTQLITHFGVTQLWAPSYVALLPSVTVLTLIAIVYWFRRAR